MQSQDSLSPSVITWFPYTCWTIKKKLFRRNSASLTYPVSRCHACSLRLHQSPSACLQAAVCASILFPSLALERTWCMSGLTMIIVRSDVRWGCKRARLLRADNTDNAGWQLSSFGAGDAVRRGLQGSMVRRSHLLGFCVPRTPPGRKNYIHAWPCLVPDSVGRNRDCAL
jgi:hypothetical protein